MKKLYIISILVAGLVSCKPNITPDKPTAGDADFSRYLSLGDFHTGGFADGTTYRSSQENDFPAIMAKAFATVGGGDFKQPLLPGELGCPSPKNILAYSIGCDGKNTLGPIPADTTKQDNRANYTRVTSGEPYNNVGTPGLRVADMLTADYISAIENVKPGVLPYAVRFYHDQAYSPYQQLQYTINTVHPTFYTLWLGFSDVFLYAQDAGKGAAVPVGSPNPGDLTPVDLFTRNYDTTLALLVKSGAKGVVITIPDILSLPFFKVIPHTKDDGTYFKVQDAAAPGGARAIADNEYLPLSAALVDSLKCNGWGDAVPIPYAYHLSAKEVNYTQTALQSYNNIIIATAKKYNVPCIDINAFFSSLQAGIVYNGVTLNAEFAKGGAYSLDGFNFTPKGNALLANYIMQFINATYHSTLPMADANKYDGIRFY